MRRMFPLFWIIVAATMIAPSQPAGAGPWERVGDAAWADVHSLSEFENTLELMLQSFEEHAVLRLPLKRFLEEADIEDILQGIYLRNDLVEASLVRMDAMIRYSYGVNTVEFLFRWIESREQRDEVIKRVPVILSAILEPGMTERQKAEAIHDHVVATVEYDDSMMGHGAWQAMQGRAVCQGYALFTCYLLSGAGIESRIVMGEDHAWNLVLVDGRWRHLDTAFDDPVIVGGPAPDMISREAFLRTDAQIRALGHRWDEKRYPEAR